METESFPCPPPLLWCLEPQLKTHLHTRAPATVNSVPEMLALCLAGNTGKDVTASWDKGFHCQEWDGGGGNQVHSQVVWDTHPGHFRFLIFFFLSELFPAASRLSSTVSHGNADRKHPPYTCNCPLPFDNRQAWFTDKTCSTSSVVIGG